MRIKPWMTTVASMLMLVAVQKETSAQQPMPPGSFPPGMAAMPMQGTGGPYVAQLPYPTNDPSVIYPPGTPPGFQPYPAISPYQAPNVAMDSHVNRDGLWFRDILYRQRKYYASVELMSVAYKDAGNTLIGSPFAERQTFDGRFPIGEPIEIDNRESVDSPNVSPNVPGFLVADTRIIPFPALASSANVYNSLINGDYYPFHNTNEMRNLGKSLGTQVRWGFENEDGTGVLVNAFWTFEDEGRFLDGNEFINGVRVTQDLTLALGGQNLFNRGVVAYFTGEPFLAFPEFGAGRTAKYDILFEMEQSTQTAGANINIYAQPVYKKKGIKIRPLFGARYFYLDEGFRFRGIDSGFTYDIDDETYRPDTPLTLIHDQYEATLHSDVQSHLAGPEIGLRFDLGNDNDGFKMWAETIFGLHANSEKISIHGDNIGDPLAEGRFENFFNPRMLDPTFQSEFSDEKSTTHVSPVFQQSIFAEVQAFRSLPLIRNVSFLESTAFRLGYTFFWVGEVSRPADSIKWQGFPLFPEAQVDRSSWHMHQLNFAIDWNF